MISDVAIALFEYAEDNQPKCTKFTWRDLVESLTCAEPARCAAPGTASDLPACSGRNCPAKNTKAWSAVTYADGAGRGKAGVTAVTTLVLDADHLQPGDIDRVRAELDSENTEYVFHSTHSHAPGDHCYRLILPVSRPMSPEEFTRVRAAVVQALDLAADDNTKDCSHIFYLPTCRAGVPFVGVHHEGVPLDVDEALAMAAGVLRMVPAAAKPAAVAPVPAEPVALDLGTLRDQIAKLRERKLRSSDPEDAVRGLLLDRVLRSRALTKPEGRGDETTLGRDSAIGKVCGMIAFALPASTPWPAVAEILRPCLSAMNPAPKDSAFWIETARVRYEKARTAKQASDAAVARVMAQFRGNASAPSASAPGATSAPEDAQPLRSGSFLSLVEILRGGTVITEALEYDEMAGGTTIDRRPIRDEDVDQIRVRIQQRCVAERSKDGSPVGLRFSAAEVARAVAMLAREKSFHPVREYLEGLAWDGEARIDRVVAEVLRAEDTPLNQAIVRRWFVSAVARPMSPGCKNDCMLVLIGDQGALKSSFFKSLAAPWFIDTAITVGTKDALATLRRAWILEWAELESINRARDVEAIKAFLTSDHDNYRPAYGRFDVVVPRTGVIVGSTNRDEFLSDDSGNRRYWPIKVGDVDLDKLRSWREQLWAEAVVAYGMSEKWWFDRDDSELVARLSEEHVAHAVGDAWSDKVLAWVENPDEKTTFSKDAKLLAVTTATVLEHALGMPAGTWKRADEMRIGAILRKAGWKKTRPTRNKPNVWSRPGRGAGSLRSV